MKCLGSMIVLVTVLIIGGFLKWRMSRRLLSGMKAYTYEQLSSSHELWDRYVNPFYDRKEEIDYSTFKKLSEDEKEQMLIARFGKEGEE